MKKKLHAHPPQHFKSISDTIKAHIDGKKTSGSQVSTTASGV
jgi:hypothetical protein